MSTLVVEKLDVFYGAIHALKGVSFHVDKGEIVTLIGANGAGKSTILKTISGLIKPGDVPPRGGLYLMDVVPDGGLRFGFPNISDNTEIVEMIASGAHVTLFTTGRGSVVGSAISPVIKVCANPDTWRRMGDDMDVNAGRILEGAANLDEVGREIFECVVKTSAGAHTRSEALGHQEFILTYKSFDPIGPQCLPKI